MYNNKYVFGLMLTLFFLCSNAKCGVLAEMNSAKDKYNFRASQTLVAYMSLDTMFADEKVRTLAKAAGNGEIKKIEAIVEQGVDVNYQGTSNATPLYWALRNLAGFKKLLELGANPNVVFEDGGSVIFWAITLKDQRFLEFSLRYGGNPNLVTGPRNMTPLIEAASPEGKNKAKMLIDAGADINAQRSNGDTAMIVAAGLGQFDFVYELLQRGADFRIKNKRGHDLVSRIEFRKKTMDPKNELTRWMEKVIVWLKEHDK